MMRVLIAPDKFKGSLDAAAVAEQIARGIRDVASDAKVTLAPIADGGEGTAEAIFSAAGAEWIACSAHDALGRSVEARYLWLPEITTVVIEMSEAGGLRRLHETERDPLCASTFGVGEMIRDSLRFAPHEIVVGLGGSATNDGGSGMARALGYHFFAEEKELTNGPAELRQLTRIVQPAARNLPKMIAAVDVNNPLLGERGATRVFGPQKGVTEDQMPRLERALTRLAEVVAREFGHDFRGAPGAGAAGGLGFGLLAFCNAELRSGFDVVAETIKLEEKIARSDLVITGEGRLDAQTLHGKGPAGVARLARKLNKPIYAIVGESAGAEAEALFDYVAALARPPITREIAISRTTDLLRERAQEIARFYLEPKEAK